MWADKSTGRTLPSFVTEELHDFLGCGILACGFAQLFRKTCHERYVVAWSCYLQLETIVSWSRQLHWV